MSPICRCWRLQKILCCSHVHLVSLSHRRPRPECSLVAPTWGRVTRQITVSGHLTVALPSNAEPRKSPTSSQAAALLFWRRLCSRSNATDLLVCPSTVVQSVCLVVGDGMLSNSQHDIHRTIIVLLNLCLTIKFAGNFVFYAKLRNNRCGGGDRRRAPDQHVIALYQFQTLDAARSIHTDHTCVINGRAAVDTTVSYTWPDRRRTVLSTRTVSSV